MIGNLLKKWQLTLILLFSTCLVGISGDAKEYSTDELETIANQIIDWQTGHQEIDESLFSPKILTNAGSESSDWFAIGVGRLGYDSNYMDYQALLSQYVSKKYEEKALLSASKATEWHRIALAYLAVGGDPTELTFDGKKLFDLIKDGTYDRGKIAPLDKQGVNGLIFALIVLDSMNYLVPEEAFETKEDILIQLLNAQNTDGGFSLTKGKSSDIDITAMAITALAPYYNSEKKYLLDTGENISVDEVIEKSLDFLSNKQSKEAGFESWGTPNPESASQVIIALTALNKDPQTDKQFIKNNTSLIDFILTFQMTDGGFIHSFDYDTSNPDAKPNESNNMASQQVLTALGAAIRQKEQMRAYYDFREEMTTDSARNIQNINQDILKIASKNDAIALYNKFNKLPNEEKRYIANYHVLSNKLEDYDIEPDLKDVTTTYKIENSKSTGTITNTKTKKKVILENNIDSNIHKIKQLEKNEVSLADLSLIYSTYYQANLLDENALSKEDLNLLEIKMNELDNLQQEITRIGEDIEKSYYPMNELGVKDFFKIKKTLNSLKEISEEDRALVFGYEDLQKSYAHTASKLRSLVISIILVITILLAFIFLMKNRKKRKKEKLKRLMLDDDEEYDDE